MQLGFNLSNGVTDTLESSTILIYLQACKQQKEWVKWNYKWKRLGKLKWRGKLKLKEREMQPCMENVRQVIAPIVAKRILENIHNLYVSFLSNFPIKIVSQKMVILSSLSQKLVSGFFPTVSFMTYAEILLSAMLPHSHTLFLCLSRCLPVSPSFRLSIKITRVCILDY